MNRPASDLLQSRAPQVRFWRFLPVHCFALTVRNGSEGGPSARSCLQAGTVRRWRRWTWRLRFSRTDRVRSESDSRRDGSHMFGDKVCGLLQALERDLGNGFERDALLGERLARKADLVSRLHLAP